MAITDARRRIAEHNITAILDAAERLLRRGEQPSISAVAGEAGVSRPTVYAHFRDRQALIQALVTRTVQRTMTAVNSTEPGRGPAREALERLIRTSWQQLADHDELAHAAISELGADAMRGAHHSAREMIRDVVERGRQDGSFRTDVPASWLVTVALALMHATVEEVRLGELDTDDGLQALTATIDSVFSSQE